MESGFKVGGPLSTSILSQTDRPLEMLISQPKGRTRFAVHQRGGELIKIFDARVWPVEYYGDMYLTSELKVPQLIQRLLSGTGHKKQVSKVILALGSSTGKVYKFLNDNEIPLVEYQELVKSNNNYDSCFLIVKKPKPLKKLMFRSLSWANLSHSADVIKASLNRKSKKSKKVNDQNRRLSVDSDGEDQQPRSQSSEKILSCGTTEATKMSQHCTRTKNRYKKQNERQFKSATCPRGGVPMSHYVQNLSFSCDDIFTSDPQKQEDKGSSHSSSYELGNNLGRLCSNVDLSHNTPSGLSISSHMLLGTEFQSRLENKIFKNSELCSDTYTTNTVDNGPVDSEMSNSNLNSASTTDFIEFSKKSNLPPASVKKPRRILPHIPSGEFYSKRRYLAEIMSQQRSGCQSEGQRDYKEDHLGQQCHKTLRKNSVNQIDYIQSSSSSHPSLCGTKSAPLRDDLNTSFENCKSYNKENLRVLSSNMYNTYGNDKLTMFKDHYYQNSSVLRGGLDQRYSSKLCNGAIRQNSRSLQDLPRDKSSIISLKDRNDVNHYEDSKTFNCGSLLKNRSVESFVPLKLASTQRLTIAKQNNEKLAPDSSNQLKNGGLSAENSEKTKLSYFQNSASLHQFPNDNETRRCQMSISSNESDHIQSPGSMSSTLSHGLSDLPNYFQILSYYHVSFTYLNLLKNSSLSDSIQVVDTFVKLTLPFSERDKGSSPKGNCAVGLGGPGSAFKRVKKNSSMTKKYKFISIAWINNSCQSSPSNDLMQNGDLILEINGLNVINQKCDTVISTLTDNYIGTRLEVVYARKRKPETPDVNEIYRLREHCSNLISDVRRKYSIDHRISPVSQIDSETSPQPNTVDINKGLDIHHDGNFVSNLHQQQIGSNDLQQSKPHCRIPLSDVQIVDEKSKLHLSQKNIRISSNGANLNRNHSCGDISITTMNKETLIPFIRKNSNCDTFENCTSNNELVAQDDSLIGYNFHPMKSHSKSFNKQENVMKASDHLNNKSVLSCESQSCSQQPKSSAGKRFSIDDNVLNEKEVSQLSVQINGPSTSNSATLSAVNKSESNSSKSFLKLLSYPKTNGTIPNGHKSIKKHSASNKPTDKPVITSETMANGNINRSFSSEGGKNSVDMNQNESLNNGHCPQHSTRSDNKASSKDSLIKYTNLGYFNGAICLFDSDLKEDEFIV